MNSKNKDNDGSGRRYRPTRHFPQSYKDSEKSRSTYRPHPQRNGSNFDNNSKGSTSIRPNRHLDLRVMPKGPRSAARKEYPKEIKKRPIKESINEDTNKKTKLQKRRGKWIKVTYYETSGTPVVYERVNQVGEGTYGKVYKAQNRITKEFVALKRLRLEGEKEGFPITAMREIRLLQSFKHRNIVGLLEMMIEKKSIHMVFDYIANDLAGVLSQSTIKLEPEHCKHLFKQLTEGLQYLHSMKVIHRDIKGSNVLINGDGVVKIADFGLARRMKDVKPWESPDYTNRVITLWYRPPELLLGCTDYGREVDIWGIGCLLVELYSKTPLFQGAEEISQLGAIFDVMGTPTHESWPEIENLPWFELLRPKSVKESKFKKMYTDVLKSQSCFELALGLLKMNPKQRISASEALESPYFKEEPEAKPLLLSEYGEWHELDAKKQRRKERRERQEKKEQEQKEEQFGDV